MYMRMCKHVSHQFLSLNVKGREKRRVNTHMSINIRVRDTWKWWLWQRCSGTVNANNLSIKGFKRHRVAQLLYIIWKKQCFLSPNNIPKEYVPLQFLFISTANGFHHMILQSESYKKKIIKIKNIKWKMEIHKWLVFVVFIHSPFETGISHVILSPKSFKRIQANFIFRKLLSRISWLTVIDITSAQRFVLPEFTHIVNSKGHNNIVK